MALLYRFINLSFSVTVTVAEQVELCLECAGLWDPLANASTNASQSLTKTVGGKPGEGTQGKKVGV